MDKTLILTNIPTPYRTKVYDLLGDDFLVVYMAMSENNRKWKINKLNHKHEVLNGFSLSRKDGYNYIHINYGIIKLLKKYKPKNVIITGLGPTHIIAYIWAYFNSCNLIYMTDGTLQSESNLSLLNKFMRWVVFKSVGVFIVASKKGEDLIKMYGYNNTFKSHLCADNDDFMSILKGFSEREYDVMFAGQIQKRKMPIEFVETCKIIKEHKGYCRALIIGSGPMQSDMLSLLEHYDINYSYPGFVESHNLKYYYTNSKILLFLSELDPWGVVANEAMASGTPVIASKVAGSADEIVIHNVTGYVADNDVELIANYALELLNDPVKWSEISHNCRNVIKEYNYTNAARGIKQSVEYLL